MAQNGFGAYVQLHVKKDAGSISAFNKEIESAVAASGKIDIGKALTVRALDESVVKTLQDRLSRLPFTIKIQRIDASAAIETVRQELAKMVEAFSLQNGVNLKGIGNFTSEASTAGARGRAAESERAASAARQEAQAEAEVVAATEATEAQKRTVIQLENQLVTIAARRQSLESQYNMSGLSQNESYKELLQNWTSIEQKIQSLHETLQTTSPADVEAVDKIKTEVAALNLELDTITKKLGGSGERLVSGTWLSDMQGKVSRKITSARSWLENNSKANGTDEGKAIQAEISELEKLKAKLDICTDATEEFRRESNQTFSNAARGIADAQAEATRLGHTGNTLLTRFKNGIEKFGGWTIVTRSLMAVIRLTRRLYKSVIEIDSAMTQLKIVTDATSERYDRFARSIANTAQTIGASTKDLIESATTYARLGYDLDQSETLAKYTSMLSKVGAIDVSEAQNAMTAITKAFPDIDINKIESTMDKLVEVGNNFPISVSQIAEGLNNASSALAGAGNSFEQSVALLTAANTTVNYCRAA